MTDKETVPVDQTVPPITAERVAAAEQVTGLTFTEAEREQLLDFANEARADYEKIRAVPLANDVVPSFTFHPYDPSAILPANKVHISLTAGTSSPEQDIVDGPLLPADLEEIAFWPVTWLAHLIKTRQTTSQALTELYLSRLKRYDPILHCVITLTEDLALEQARRADTEIASGHYRGPLHGIPWGVKDLLATRHYPTTWGSPIFKNQVLDYDATVVQRMEEAGAVLVAKLSLGELAMDDEWFGGTTRSPWDISQGSSGSSAGSGAAVAGGLVGFAIGTETHGSIISPSTRCRTTGLRPTTGRVSRHGAMMLSWTMDKIGPMARSVEDCALVFEAIYGPDGKDRTLVDRPFQWPLSKTVKTLRIGYAKADFEKESEHTERQNAALAKLRELGFELIPIELPDYPVDSLGIILFAEAAASFDELTRSNRDDQMVRQGKDGWPYYFRGARLIPAVEYIQAQRVRELLGQAMAERMSNIDVYVTPSFGASLLLTNLTGHPAVVVPNGLTADNKPSSLTFIGNLFAEAEALAVAHMFQNVTEFHRERPTFTSSQPEV